MGTDEDDLVFQARWIIGLPMIVVGVLIIGLLLSARPT